MHPCSIKVLIYLKNPKLLKGSVFSARSITLVFIYCVKLKKKSQTVVRYLLNNYPNVWGFKGVIHPEMKVLSSPFMLFQTHDFPSFTVKPKNGCQVRIQELLLSKE